MNAPHPLAESDSRPKDEATAPEAAAWLLNPNPPPRKPTQAQLWIAEIERGEVWPDDKPSEHQPAEDPRE